MAAMIRNDVGVGLTSMAGMLCPAVIETAEIVE